MSDMALSLAEQIRAQLLLRDAEPLRYFVQVVRVRPACSIGPRVERRAGIAADAGRFVRAVLVDEFGDLFHGT